MAESYFDFSAGAQKVFYFFEMTVGKLPHFTQITESRGM
jgi:hypothetical protein